MRKLWLVAVVAMLGCSDLFSTRADLVARAADHELTAEQLANWLSRIKGLKINADAAEFMANVWVDYTLVAEAVAQGTLPRDSAAVAEVMWPNVAEIKADLWYDHLLDERAPVTAAGADSVYREDSVRVFQHILFSVAPSATEAVREATRREARRVLRQARNGGDFAALATRYSGDPGSKDKGGFLVPNPRGSYVAPFDSAGWRLGEGEISNLVYTPFGIHIIKRPARSEARDVLLDWMREIAQQRLDSVYLVQLGEARNLKVSSSAPALIRQSLDDERGMRGSGKNLATFDGGALTVADFLRWVPALGPAASRQIRGAPDDQLHELVLQLGRNQLILDQADSAGMSMNELQWLGIRQEYDAKLDTLQALLRLGDDVTDPTLTPAQRSEVVGLKIDGYFDRVAAGLTRLLAPPPALPDVLRRNSTYEINMAGVARAADLATQAKDSVVGNQGSLQPAPGPPPVPGAAGADTAGAGGGGR